MPTRTQNREHETSQHGSAMGGGTMAPPICEFLRCMGVHRLFKILKFLLQKAVKSTKSLFSHLWFNTSTFFFHNPPLVLFSLNLIIFTLILTFISLYANVVKVSESGEEWKGFLQSFTKLELCIIPFNANSTTTPPITNRNPGTQPATPLGTHSIPISLSISPTWEFNTIPQNLFHLSTSMYGKHMGLEGEHSQVLINITLSFRHTWNSSACDGSKLVPCQFTDINGCISFHGPKKIFPENKHVEHCPKNLKNPRGNLYYATLNWQMPDVNPLYYCRSRSMIKVTFDRFLSESNREKVIEPSSRFHLLSTSLILTFFVAIIFLYAAMFSHQPRYAYLRRVSSCSDADS